MAQKLRTFSEQIERYAIPEPNTGCWLWMGVLDRGGYAKVSASHRTERASRMSWEVANGPIPDGLFACHRCDNRACVNPDHLFLGTHRDNMRDMASKGRSARGERNVGAKLCEKDISEIHEMFRAGATTSDVAKRFGVRQESANKIARGVTWSHVGQAPKSRRPMVDDGAVDEIRRRVAAGEPRAAIAKSFGVNRKTAFNIASGRTRGV